jgi:hypothetical protein
MPNCTLQQSDKEVGNPLFSPLVEKRQQLRIHNPEHQSRVDEPGEILDHGRSRNGEPYGPQRSGARLPLHR